MSKPKPLPEIESCPFCKMKRGVMAATPSGVMKYDYFVRCGYMECFAAGPRRKTKRNAIIAWNGL